MSNQVQHPHLPCISDIEDAMRANNQSSDPGFKQEFCTCDPSVGHCSCAYCTVHDTLRRCRDYAVWQAAAGSDLLRDVLTSNPCVQCGRAGVECLCSQCWRWKDDNMEALKIASVSLDKPIKRNGVRTCANCKHNLLDEKESPCASCLGNKWEPILADCAVHSEDCAVALNGRHDCSCGAEAESFTAKLLVDYDEDGVIFSPDKRLNESWDGTRVKVTRIGQLVEKE